MNAFERIRALQNAAPLVQELREKDTPWERVAACRKANPTGLSARQLARIYGGPGAYEFPESLPSVPRSRICAENHRPE